MASSSSIHASSSVHVAWNDVPRGTTATIHAWTPLAAAPPRGPSSRASLTMTARRRSSTTSAAAAAAASDDDDDADEAAVRAAVLASLPSICPGCGVGLQCDDQNKPGFFVVPKRLLDETRDKTLAASADDPSGVSLEADAVMAAKLREAAEMEGLGGDDDGSQMWDDDDPESMTTFALGADFDDGLNLDRDPRDARDMDDDVDVVGGDDEVDEDAALAALDALFGDGDDVLDEAELRRQERAARRSDAPAVVTCARCYSLRNYGKVKNQAAEILMPSFDFARVVGDRLSRLGPGSAVVLLLVDVVDFDASFPVDAVDFLHPYVMNETVDVLLVGTKVDLLPTQCTRTRVSSFCRRRAKTFGLSRASGVHLVSAHTGMGVNLLSEQLEQLLEEGREVWVVGAQNAGKSSLINRLSKRYGGPDETEGGPLASHLPGTTLGVVKLESLLPNGSDVYDTPGLLQPFQVSSRLSNEEARMVLPRARLRPRTYRAEIGSSLHIGGLARIDVLDGPQRTLYLTVWVSQDVPLHYMLRTEKADALREKHAGTKLVPPIGEQRVRAMGEWGSRVVNVYGEDWTTSTRDISIGGLGWVGVGVKGNAAFRVWTNEGVQVETRESLVPDMARDLQRPGFSDEQQLGGGGKKGRPSKRIVRKGGYKAPKKSARRGGGL